MIIYYYYDYYYRVRDCRDKKKNKINVRKCERMLEQERMEIN